MVNKLDGYSLGNLTSERVLKEANLMIMTLPGSDSDAALFFDLTGASRTFTLEGVIETAGKSAANTVVLTLQNKIDGSQNVVAYVSDLYPTDFDKAVGNSGVVVSSVETSVEVANPFTLVHYRIVLFEAQ